MTTDEKKNALQKVADEIAATGGGPLAAAGVNSVPGEGNPDAEIMFIGEAPGFHENEERRPFVGQAGKLLRKAIRDNGFREDEVYITNIVKYRPPGNRDPDPAEIAFFQPFLDKQIEIIDPKIIVTVGRFSMYKFLGPAAGITKVHGQSRTREWNGKEIVVFPMFHSAAALRDGKVMQMFLEDFKKLREILDKINKGQNIGRKMEDHQEAKEETEEQLKLV